MCYVSGNRLRKGDKALNETKIYALRLLPFWRGWSRVEERTEMTDYNKQRSQAYKTLDHDACYEKNARIQGNESAWCKKEACN